ncbi:hypothetical protein H1R20_g11714, partial [Candolleomyces eurysporus]
MQPNNEIYTDYYYADHSRKIVFFLDEVEAHTNIPAWSQLKGVTSMAHLKHEIEAQYCELNTMLGQVNNLRKNVGSDSPGAVNLLTRQKFLNWHGVPEARIYRDQSVHGERRHKTFLIKILSPLLFSAPDVHLKSLEKLWVDGLMHGPVWREAIGKLNEEWQEFTLYATVLLNANVAYLAIQSIDTQLPGHRSPVQIGCYLSIVASIGSIILGLLLLRQNRSRIHGTMDEVNAFLQRRRHPRLGLETLAILYSLPYALLLWGMVSFLAAIGWNCFDGSNTATRFIMGAAWVALAVLVLWCVWMGWQPHESGDEEGNSTAADGDTPPTPEEEDSAAANRDAQPHVSPSKAGSMRAVPLSNHASRTSVLNVDDQGGSMLGELTRFKFWKKSWTGRVLFGGSRRPSVDSQNTVVEKQSEEV